MGITVTVAITPTTPRVVGLADGVIATVTVIRAVALYFGFPGRYSDTKTPAWKITTRSPASKASNIPLASLHDSPTTINPTTIVEDINIGTKDT